jgi:predicted DNA-binding ribbon-helix-helix protein
MEARADGAYWAAAEARRTARRPTHVDVDPEAWKAVRQIAVRQGITVGRLVGDLVVRETQRLDRGGTPLSETSGRRGPSGSGRRARRFARLEVDLGPWTTLRSGAIAANLTVARYVGLLVETTGDRSRT